MGFRLPGKSITSGTSGHKSALKMVAEQRAASALKEVKERETSWFRGEEGWIPDELQGGDKATVITGDDGSGKTEKTIKNENREEHLQNVETETKTKAKEGKPKTAYGGDRTWEQAQKESKASGGDLNQTTRDQKAYEKQKKAENPDWNKREDNQWKKRQNTINSSLGSKKVYEVDSEVEKIKDEQVVRDENIVKEAEENPTMNVVKNDDGEDVYGGALDADKELNKSERKATRKIGRQKVKDARKEFGRGSDEVKAAKVSKRSENKKATTMVKTGKKDRKFVDRDEKLQIRIDKRKDKGRNTSNLENKQAKNKQKETEFGESLG